MSYKMLDRFEKILDLLARRAVINGFLSVCLAAACLMFIPISDASAQSIATQVQHRKDVEIYHKKMRDELTGAATERDDLTNEKQNEPNGMGPDDWYKWALNQPAHSKWIEDYEAKNPPPTISNNAGGDQGTGGGQQGGGQQGGDQQGGGGGQQGGGQQADGGGQQGGGQQGGGGGAGGGPPPLVGPVASGPPDDPLTPLSPPPLTPVPSIPAGPVPVGPPVGPPPPYGTLTCNYTDGSGGTASFTTTDSEIVKQGCPPYIFPGLTLVGAPPSGPAGPTAGAPAGPTAGAPSGPTGGSGSTGPSTAGPPGGGGGGSSGGQSSSNGPQPPIDPLGPGGMPWSPLIDVITALQPPTGGAPPTPPQIATNTPPPFPPTQPPVGGGSTAPQCPSGYVNWSCQNATGTTSGCLTPEDAANSTAKYTAMGGYTCSTSNQLSPSNPASANSSICPPPNHQYACEFALVCAPSIGSITGDSNCKPVPDTSAAPTPPPKLYADLNLKPREEVQSCESKPPFLPWGGTGSASITVSGGEPCAVGWHDTGGVVIDSMQVTSRPSHGTPTVKNQHEIIFTPAHDGYKGPDSFSLRMQEHYSDGRKATLTVNVSVTIK